MDYAGEIWPVHPKKDAIRGRRVYRSVEELPDSPDAAYVGVNRHLTIDIVRDLAARDAGGAICYATGFIEAGEEGSELSRQLLEASGGMPLIGPNCYGLVNYLDGAIIWPDQQGGRRVDEGVAIITMSSNVGFNLTMQRRGLPVAYMLSLGNKLKFDLHDAIEIFAREERVTALGLYVEAMTDPLAFEDAVLLARKLGKPIVAIKTGRSEAAQKIVVSHTASLAGSDALISALFKRLGVARVGSLEALMEALKVLHVLGPLDGGRLGAMSTSGGDLTLIADAMIGTDLTMPPLSDEVSTRVGETVHERIVAANPLDFQMFDWNNADRMAETFTAFISDDFDATLCVLDYPREDLCDQSTWLGAERGFVRAVHERNHKGVVLSTFSDTISETVATRLIAEGIAPLAGIDTGLAGIQAAVEVGAAWRNPPKPHLIEMVGRTEDESVEVLDEAESKAFLSRLGVPVAPSEVVGNSQEAAVAAEELGYPAVVKALGVAHKTEVGGVKLDLGNAEEVSVGGGGILVELMRDSVSLLLPVSGEEVMQALEQLECAPLFHGFRGRPHADLKAAIDAIMAIANWVEKDPALVVELDVNPLLLLADGEGVIAADALIRMRMLESSDAKEGAKAFVEKRKPVWTGR